MVQDFNFQIPYIISSLQEKGILERKLLIYGIILKQKLV